ncbi:hypothetical protein NB722_000820 [Xanthomonas sacchari]|uniref:MASE1 domain-containing protein n=1 Tax=Xanthomonas sacchari TaxID=56458 RepID=UPI002251BC22|nr:MASE1 domain-containing protein [Xanthomonas sacchari]MCW0386281.1 hypothetical protein [Xanthomonas sacchari]
MDQWYLPAGLRAATLLFMPYRFWPYLLAGDAAALLTIRVPMVEGGASPLCAYASPFLLMPCVALAVHAARRHLPRLLDQEHLLLPLSLALALWSTLCNVAMNVTLKGYTALTPMEALARYWLGDYLGMLMFILPAPPGAAVNLSLRSGRQPHRSLCARRVVGARTHICSGTIARHPELQQSAADGSVGAMDQPISTPPACV